MPPTLLSNPRPSRPSVQGARLLASGVSAALLSSLAVAVASRRRTGSFVAGVNATSHIVHGEAAFDRGAPSLAHTGVGLLLHGMATLTWAAVFTALQRHRNEPHARPSAWVDAGVTAALAYGVDYALTPRRFTPGYERHLHAGGMWATYGALALGLALPSLLQSGSKP
jgi:hypothetical protein